MSIEAITLVRTLTRRGVYLEPRDRFVLYALADFANDKNEAWPSLSTISEWTGYDRRTIIRALESLEASALIKRTRRARGDGSMTSNTYTLQLHTRGSSVSVTPPSDTQTLPSDTQTPGGVTESLGVVSESHPKNHQEEPPLNPHNQKTSQLATRAENGPPPSAFLEAWNEHRGNLPEARSLNGSRINAINRLRKEHGEHALTYFIAATRQVSSDEFYIEKQYGLDTLLRPGRVQERAERFANSAGMSDADRRLASRAQRMAQAIGLDA